MASPARRLREPAPPSAAPAEPHIDALESVSAAVESGAGLPEVVRAAARALDASLAVTDPGGAVLASSTRSSADERSLLAGGSGIETLELRLGDQTVGRLRMRARAGAPSAAALSLVRTLIATEAQRVQAAG